MAHTTACPACGTTFRVTAEQLLARNGNVRCGRCAHVFNAHPSLALDYPQLPDETPAAEESPVYPEQPAVSGFMPEAEPYDEPPPDPEPESRVEFASEPEPEFVPATPEPLAQSEPAFAAEAEQSFEETPVLLPQPKLPPLLPKKRNLRRLLPLGVVLMLLGLAAQIMMHFRTELVVLSPGLKPAFEQVCGIFGCRVTLPQNADFLSIESSSLEADPGYAGIVALNAVLRNRAPYRQANPLFELTITDYQDKLIARRIFQPREYLPPESPAQIGMPANEEIDVKLHIDLGETKAAGYRVYLFYPSTAS
jgi:predicted Zn finger-like uncharacterized protein